MKTENNIAFVGTTQSSPATEEAVVNNFISFIKTIIEDGVRKVLLEQQEAKESARLLYTKKETEERLGISQTTLYRIIKLNPGALDTVKVGTKLMFTKESVESFIENKENTKTK